MFRSLGLFACVAASALPLSALNAQAAEARADTAGASSVGVATRVTPPKRRADEAIGAFSEPTVWGMWLAVRSAMPNQDAPGAVQIYRKSDASWAHFQTLLSPDDRPVDDGFGWATAFDANTLAIGAPDHEVNGVHSGAVFIYTFDGDKWVRTATIASPDPAANSYFGQHIALDRGTLVVGEAREAQPGGWAPNRAAYVFKMEASDKWRLQATLPVPAELAATAFPRGSHGFGNHVDVAGKTIAIAARDRVYLYQRRGADWRLEQKLDAPRDPNDDAGGPSYGRSLDIDGDLLVVAALRAASTVPDAGAAFVYRRKDGQWHQEAKLTASDGATRDMFGHWVALDDGIIVSGAFRHAVDGHRQVGAAYVYRQVNGTWTETRKIVPSEPEQQQFTAYGVAIDGNTVVMSAGVKPDQSKSDYFWTFDLTAPTP